MHEAALAPPKQSVIGALQHIVASPESLNHDGKMRQLLEGMIQMLIVISTRSLSWC